MGDAVAMDEVVGEIETDKTALPIVSPAAGVIEELFIGDGEKVMKGDQLFKLKLGEAASPSKGDSPSESSASAAKEEEAHKDEEPPKDTESTPSEKPPCKIIIAIT